MPGVLLIEAMAQTAAVLAVAGLGPAHEGNPVYFMSVDGARFRRPVRPGDQLRLEVDGPAQQAGRVEVRAARPWSTATVAAEAEFSAKISLTSLSRGSALAPIGT